MTMTSSSSCCSHSCCCSCCNSVGILVVALLLAQALKRRAYQMNSCMLFSWTDHLIGFTFQLILSSLLLQHFFMLRYVHIVQRYQKTVSVEFFWQMKSNHSPDTIWICWCHKKDSCIIITAPPIITNKNACTRICIPWLWHWVYK